LKQDDDTNQELSDDKSEDPREATLSFDIQEDDFDHQEEVLFQGQGCRDKSL
jgi:hypothetical protein